MRGFYVLMPAGILPKDFNFQNAVGGTSSASDSGASIKPFQYDPDTRGMLVHIVGDDAGLSGPPVDSYSHDVINITDGANNLIVAAPGANKQIWVYGIFGTMSAQGIFSVQDEDDTAISGVIPFAQYSGPNISPSGNFAMPIWKVATNKALEIDLSGADFDGWLDYAIISI